MIMVINKNHLSFVFGGMHNKQSALVEAWRGTPKLFDDGKQNLARTKWPKHQQ